MNCNITTKRELIEFLEVNLPDNFIVSSFSVEKAEGSYQQTNRADDWRLSKPVITETLELDIRGEFEVKI